MRVIDMPSAPASIEFFIVSLSIVGLLALNGPEVFVECVKSVVPYLASFTDPVDRHIETFGLEAAWSRLSLAPTGDEAAVLEDLDVLGHSLKGEIEWFSQLVYRRLAPREAYDDRPAGGVRQSIERGIEVLINKGHRVFTLLYS